MKDYMSVVIRQLEADYEAAKKTYEVRYGNFSREEIMLAMSDGIKLRTTIYRPADKSGQPTADTLPVIVERGCYPHNAVLSKIHGEQLALLGYAFVSQFCRGTGGSEGEWVPNVHERQDGLDTLNWLNDQQWVDAIGYWGNSYLALTGWAVADQVPDKVRGMCLTHYGTDRFTSAYEKGMFRQDVLTAWAKGNAGRPIDAGLDESYRYRPQIEVDEKLWGIRLDWYRDWICNPHRDDDYWQQGFWKLLREIPQRVKVPIYMRSGWYDHHHGSSMKTWNSLNPSIRQHCWLDIGGWNHGFWPCLEDLATDNMAPSEVLAFLPWFELTLRDKAVPSQRVRAYAIGEDRWLELPNWPIERKARNILYFNGGGHDGYTGTLDGRSGDPGRLTFVFDPEDPVPSLGSESLLVSMQKNGSLAQPSPGYRPDVLSFVSAPLDRPLTIAGELSISLSVSTDADDTAFAARVMEIRKNGKAYSIRSSIASLSYDDPTPYEPGSVRKLTIDFWAVVYALKPGSRIRIDIASSDFPQYHIHSNYAGPWALQDRVRKARQTIHVGDRYPSLIEIPYLDSARA